MQMSERKTGQGRICRYTVLSESHVLLRCFELVIRHCTVNFSEYSGLFIL